MLDPNLPRFSAERVSAIAARYGFRDSNRLHAKLVRVAERYAFHQTVVPPTFAERRKAAERVLRDAESLTRSILELDKVTGSYMADEEAREGITRIQKAAKENVGELKGKRSGRPANYARRILVVDLRRVYRFGTGRNERYTHDLYSETYCGPFVAFCAEVGEQLGVELPGRFVAGVLDDVFPKSNVG